MPETREGPWCLGIPVASPIINIKRDPTARAKGQGPVPIDL